MTMKTSISAIILTKNEEKNIERCIKSLMFCDEIIVVDDYSEDNTIKQITNFKFQISNQIQSSKCKIIIHQRKLGGDFAAQRNFAKDMAKGEWVLYVDADEIVTSELKEEILSILKSQIPNSKSQINSNYQNSNFQNTGYEAFAIKRRDFFMGREMKYGETKKVRDKGIVRLVKKGSGAWNGEVHEEFRIQNVEFRINTLKGYINHYPHQTINEFISDINLYSSLRAKELYNHNKRTNILEIICYPFFKFILTYFIKLGFLDGPQGFIYSFFMSFHSFLVRAKFFQYAEKP
jgi:glycosyltransferase involved in cell wall biosynthesis